MTRAERIGQLNLLAAGEGLATGAGGPSRLAERLDAGEVGSVFGTKSLESARAMQERAVAGSRLGIPLLLAEDVIHGHRTIFPLPVALACSWDVELIEETAAHAAAEAAAEGLHQVYAPMLDVSRDPRWGRVAESPGEDPVLASRIAEAMVRGLQGPDPAAPGRVAACLKHFVAYGAPTSGRDYDNASLAWEDLLGVHLPPFAAGVAAGAASVMAGFNAVNKTPMHAHEPLVEGWLRRGEGFDGLVVSDYTGVQELEAHGLGPRAAVVVRALVAGVDMDMVGEDYLRELPALCEEGIDAPDCGIRLSAEEVGALVDRACLRVLGMKARLGLLADPLRGTDGRHPAPTRPRGRALARRAAARSAVLLRNDGLLPLPARGRVALIGPFAEDRANMLGTWAVSGDSREVRTLREALEDRPGLEIRTAMGSDVVDEAWLVDRLNVHGRTVRPDERPAGDMLAEAVALARDCDVVVLALGEAKEHAGESSSRLLASLPGPQRRLAAAVAETGTPIVVVVFAGRPLALGDLPGDALLLAWHGGTAGPDGVADLLLGDAEPSGRLAVTLPAAPGQTPIHHSEESTGRPFPGRWQKFRTGWLDLADDATGYPFGYGLSYSEVRYGEPTASAPRLRGDATLKLSVAVANLGPRPAEETVQLYLSDPVARITRPARTLLDFRRIALAPNEAQRVRFEVTRDDLRYWLAPSLAEAERVWDPGAFVFHTGPNSRDTQAVEVEWLA